MGNNIVEDLLERCINERNKLEREPKELKITQDEAFKLIKYFKQNPQLSKSEPMDVVAKSFGGEVTLKNLETMLIFGRRIVIKG